MALCYFVLRVSWTVDFVFGGHSHTYMKALEYVTDLDGRKIPVDQNGSKGAYVGKLVVTLEP